MIKRFFAGVAVGLSVLGLIGETPAQTFPARPITIVVPFAAGGPTDIVARVIAAQFTNNLGQQGIVENVVGAAGTTGMVRAARAAADGYTLLMAGMSTMSFSPTLYPSLPAHSINSFEPIGIVASAPIVLVVGKQVPANTVNEFAAHLRGHADRMANGHAGVGSSSHLACALLNSRFGVSPSVVPYRGTAPVMNDILSGQIHYMCDQTTSVMAQVQAGGVKALAVLAQLVHRHCRTCRPSRKQAILAPRWCSGTRCLRPRVRRRRSSSRLMRQLPKASMLRQHASSSRSSVLKRRPPTSVCPRRSARSLHRHREMGESDPRRRHSGELAI